MSKTLFSRTEQLIGAENLKKLQNSHVAVFGVGGVGSYAAEALARSGVGRLTLVDSDAVDITNINRQLQATTKTIGRLKTLVMKERILEVNPAAKVTCVNQFILPNTENTLKWDFDYAADAVDTVTAKLFIIESCVQKNIPVISSMGMGNKLDAACIEVSDIYKTSICPLAKVMRYELKKRGIRALKVVYSKEKPHETVDRSNRRGTPASIAFVPGTAGLIMAGEIIKDLISDE